MSRLAVEALKIRFRSSAIREQQWEEVTNAIHSRFPSWRINLDSKVLQRRLRKNITASDQYQVTMDSGEKRHPPSTSALSRAVIFCSLFGTGEPTTLAQTCPLFQDFFRENSFPQRQQWRHGGDYSYLSYAWVNVHSLLFSRKFVSDHERDGSTDFTLVERWGWPGPYSFGELASEIRWFGRSVSSEPRNLPTISVVVSSTATKLLYSDTLGPAYMDAIENGSQIRFYFEKESAELQQLRVRFKDMQKSLDKSLRTQMQQHVVRCRSGSPFSLSMGWIAMQKDSTKCVRIVRELPDEEKRRNAARRPTVLEAHGTEEKRFWEWLRVEGA